jgi:hypothetical protein
MDGADDTGASPEEPAEARGCGTARAPEYSFVRSSTRHDWVPLGSIVADWSSQSKVPPGEILDRLLRYIKASVFLEISAFRQRRRTGSAAWGYFPLSASDLGRACCALFDASSLAQNDAEAVFGEIVVSEEAMLGFCRCLKLRPPNCLLVRRNPLDWLGKRELAPSADGPTAAQIAAAKAPQALPGVPKGSKPSGRPYKHRGLREADAPLVDAALRMVTDDPSLSYLKAVEKLGPNLPGRGSLASRRKRIYSQLLKRLN